MCICITFEYLLHSWPEITAIDQICVPCTIHVLKPNPQGEWVTRVEPRDGIGALVRRGARDLA